MIEANGVRTAAAAVRGPSMGQFVSLRGRLWLVEEQPETPFDGHRLACVDDDASGEDAQVLWSAEVDARLRDEEAWASLASGGGDAETFSAYLRTVRWRTATAAERDLFQAPFRAGTGADIESLRALHHAMDRAVLAAYGWEDLAAEAAPVFLDADSEDDHRYQGRLFWPAPFRDAVLARLLTLNEERATMERML